MRTTPADVSVSKNFPVICRTVYGTEFLSHTQAYGRPLLEPSCIKNPVETQGILHEKYGKLAVSTDDSSKARMDTPTLRLDKLAKL